MSSPDAADRIARRYGRGRRRPGRPLLIGLLVIVVLVVCWFGWALWVSLHPKVTSGLETWHTRGRGKVVVSYDVRLHGDGVVATCKVQAEDPNQTVLGHLEFKVRKSGPGHVSFKTVAEAARVDWKGCTALGQKDAR